jgi:hypothetical protein
MLGRGYTEKELKPILERMVKEALTMNEDITSCHDFKITKESDKVTILFMVDTIYGTTDMEVDYNV